MAAQAASNDLLAKLDTTSLAVTKQSSPISARTRDYRDAVLNTIQDTSLGFKAWATNIAALQESHLKSSLDFRLQEAIEIRQRVLKILEDLKESFIRVFSIVTGTRVNETWKVGILSDSEEDEENSPAKDVVQTSELAELLSAMRTAKSNLMDLSIVIRNTPTRDDDIEAAARYSLDPQRDIGHVHEKFRPAKRSSVWLIQRLGKSITRRRHKLQEKPVNGRVDGEELEKTIAFTKATTFIVAQPSAPKSNIDVSSFGSQTSYEQAIIGETNENDLTVPGLPIEAFESVPFEFEKPFQCPYCYTEQSVKTRNVWKEHVFRDLRPYVCTFTECSLRMFQSRNEWFAHEF
ncbi:hypothetical protein B0O99DRAFT_672154 [Bisporella sp. PMI_857]|nr:hypothetical protein B0O99DRAFT_672154 [Bisporella sp. PMI_857]